MPATRIPEQRDEPAFHFTVIGADRREHSVTVFAESAAVAFATAQRAAPEWLGEGSVVDAMSVRRRR